MASKTTTLKKKNKNNTGALIGSILILVIVVISFVLAPALSDIANSSVNDIVMGSYGNEKITYSFVRDTPFKREIASLSSGSTDSADYRLLYSAYNRAVTKAAAISEFDSNGYEITRKQLDEAVINSGYYNVDGAFSADLFKATPEGRKVEIRDAIERELKLQSWEYHIFHQQRRSKKSVDFISKMGDKKRNFNYVTFNYTDYPAELIREYGSANIDRFKELSLSRITVNTESLADEIVGKIEAGEATFGDLAKEHSLDNFKDNGGVMSSKTYTNELKSIFGIEDSSELLSKKVGDSPVKVTLDGQFILLALNKEIVEPDFSKLNNLERVRTYMLSNERGIIEDYFISKLSNVNSLEELGKDVKATGDFSLNFGGESLIPAPINRVSIDPIFQNAVANENFFTTLFTLEENSISSPIVLGDSVSVFQLIEETMSPVENEYFAANIARTLLNYKTSAEGKRFQKSNKYENNFTEGYLEIYKATQGNNY